jgi:hypothetical protein
MSGVKTSEALLGDFRTDSRMLLLVAFALPLGVISAFVAEALLWMIAEITNVVFFQRFSPQMETLQHHHVGAWVIAAAVVGALIIGLMARYGSEKIRPRHSRSDRPRRQFDPAEGRDAQANLIGKRSACLTIAICRKTNPPFRRMSNGVI